MPPDVPPVIDKLYDLILWMLPHIAKFPRSQRFVLGDRIERSMLDVQDLLIEAAYSRRKTELLRQANIQLEKIRYLIRLAKDLRCAVIEPIFERAFIHDSYANRKGKGTHRAADRFTAFCRQNRYGLVRYQW
ncbi:MAG: hypothetical protein ETSY1_22235 [Candidatus Entotheonella factor]|uniref:bAvd-like domain-containing protein n=1 Tax=Entotheonella factor TaxID=1429438 RepID=W4LJL8_ENTF1|nr:four helix bundle protein [Candidatus Entotheonella palauensis]ETW97546.1 MAG: hypothetical protein ETSY1_22235 [Candidatus Entotheonella factor]